MQGASSRVSLAALSVVLKSSRIDSSVSPGGRFPMCSRRARRVSAACCCSSAVIIAVSCILAIALGSALPAAPAAVLAGGATSCPDESTSHIRARRRLRPSPSFCASGERRRGLGERRRGLGERRRGLGLRRRGGERSR